MKTKIAFAATCMLIVIGEMVYRGASQRSELFSWYHILLTGFAFLAVAGERILDFKINKSGFVLKQAVEQFAKEAGDLQTLSRGKANSEIDELLTLVRGHKPTIWTSLIVQRLLLRVLLRGISAGHGRQLGDTDSLQQMIKELKEKKVFDDDLGRDLERIRHATFFAEWGSGHPPTRNDVTWVLEKGPAILRKLHDDFM